jgi:hypothetical protein
MKRDLPETPSRSVVADPVSTLEVVNYTDNTVWIYVDRLQLRGNQVPDAIASPNSSSSAMVLRVYPPEPGQSRFTVPVVGIATTSNLDTLTGKTSGIYCVMVEPEAFSSGNLNIEIFQLSNQCENVDRFRPETFIPSQQYNQSTTNFTVQ